MVKYEAGLGMRLWVAFGISACLAMMIAAVLLARRNLKLGRGDRRGATRLAVFVMIAFALRWLLWADHSLAIKEEFSLLTQTIAICMFAGGLTWLVYIALEPFLRRRWPKTLVSWNRLLMGRFRDPLIGRDLVAGVTACYGWGLLIGWPVQVIPVWLNILPPMPEWYGPIENLLGGRYVAGTIIRDMLYPIFMTMGLLFFLACLRVVLRKQWLAFVAFVLITSVPSVLLVEPPWLFFILGAQLSLWTLALLLLSRFGFLSVCAFWASAFLGMSTSSAPDWYVPTAVVFTLVILALAGYGLIISLGGRPILGEAVLPED
jgi:serine/threonine-protein kinase